MKIRETIKRLINEVIFINEAIEHKTALDFIAQQIKNTIWAGKIFLAGGAVRDELMGYDVKDLDLTVAADNGGIEFANWITKKNNCYVEGSNPIVFPTFGTAKFNFRGIKYKGIDLSNVDIECVMTRKEKYEQGNRKPEVAYGTPTQDVERRDLTVNSLLKDLTTGEILDLTGKGISDIKNGIVRTPLDPEIIFKEDPLRMLRAIRFTIKYDWELPFFMIKALKNNSSLLKTISSERIQEELNKILLTKNPDKGIKLLQITGLATYIFPEFEKIVKQASNNFHQWTTDKHTYEVLKKSPQKLIVRLAALFHDIGKGTTKTGSNKDDTHFLGHEEESAKIAKDIMMRLRYPLDVISAVEVLILNHMRTKSFGFNAEIVSDKAIRKLANDLGEHLEDTLDLIDADNKSRGEENWQSNMPNQVNSIRDRLKTLGDFTKKLNIPINGSDVLKLTGEKPGKIIGQLLGVIKDKFLENPDITKQEAEQIIKIEYNKLKDVK